jgi:hypothetical protein
LFKNKINFVKFIATVLIYFPSSFFAVAGSGMGKNQDPANHPGSATLTFTFFDIWGF